MKFTLLFFAVALLAGCATHRNDADDARLQDAADGQPDQIISKAQVQAVVDSVDKALLNKDADAVVANYSSDAEITSIIVGNGLTNTINEGVVVYKSRLAGFSGVSDYTIQRNDISIEIAPDGKTAQHSSTIIEKYGLNGKMHEAASKDCYTLGMSDGKVVITKELLEVNIK